MNTTATYSANGTTITFRKSLRNQMLYHHLRDVLTPDADVAQHGERLQYAFVAAFVQDVDGIDWTPPQLGDSNKKIEAGYQQWLDAIPDYESFNAIYDVINTLHKPLADPVQRPDDTLTDEEKADPN